MACTTLLVGKGASYDGSTIIARNEDSQSGVVGPKKFMVVLPEDQPRHYRSTGSHAEIDLPANPLRYTSVPDALQDGGIWGEAGVNELGVGMSATETLTSNARVLSADPLVELRPAAGVPGTDGYKPEVPGGIGEEDMLTIVLPYIRSAREGVLLLGSYLERLGTCEMNGIAFSDKDEIWWMETVGGHRWIAKRVPDDCYVVMPNQLGIDEFDLTDALGAKTEHLCSPDLEEWMDAHHLDLSRNDLELLEDGTQADWADWAGADHRLFNPREAFGSLKDSDHVYNTPRAWDMHRTLNPGLGWDNPRAGWNPEDDDIPWCMIAPRKITIEDVGRVLARHYQGTPYDPYGTRGTADERGRYRPVGINRNEELSVIQIRPSVPDACSAVQWLSFSSNAFNTLVPLFANVTCAPAYLSGTTNQVTTENFYWASRMVGALADAHYRACMPHIERYREKVMSQGHAAIDACDARVVQALDAGGPGASDVPTLLEEANEAIVSMLKDETDKVLHDVLVTATLGMKNGFALSD